MTGFDLGDPAADADDELEETADEQDEQNDSSSEPDVTSTVDQEQPDEPVPETRTTERSETGETRDANDDHDDPDPANVGPSFPYSEVRQSPLYARAKTWDELEDQLGITLTPKFREEGVRDDELREVHDAILEVALEHLDEVSDRVLEKRIKSYRNEEF